MGPHLPSTIAVLGLGYVGLDLARGLGEHFTTTGFDVNPRRIAELKAGQDGNKVGGIRAIFPPRLSFTTNPEDLATADFFIVAVPTPVDKVKRPDLSFVKSASALVGKALATRRHVEGNGIPPVIVYESTVYPGCTDEVCVPIIESESGLKRGRDFKMGYSPERINPGDTQHTLATVIKVVSGEDDETLDRVAAVYGRVAKAGVYRAPNIRTAEAAKVIENIQRDLNIALMNELSILFHRLDIDLQEVLKASRTKWNFLPFEPGLVGGHCIPEDPYYLTHKAEEVGYHPDVILAGRRVNDGMGVHVARETIKLLIKGRKVVRDASVLVLGVTFKENVPDVRNTRVVDLVRELESHCVRVFIHDPLVSDEITARMGLKSVADPFGSGVQYDAVVLAVPHEDFRRRSPEAYLGLLKNGASDRVLVDIRGILRGKIKDTAVLTWSL